MFWDRFKKEESRVEKPDERRRDGTLQSKLGHTDNGTGADMASTDTEVLEPSPKN